MARRYGSRSPKFIDEIDRAGLHYKVTAADTVIEGTWVNVTPVLQRPEQRMRERHSRAFMLLTLDDHVGARDDCAVPSKTSERG